MKSDFTLYYQKHKKTMSERNEELEELMAEARNNRISPDDQLALIEKIRSGHADAIYKLADSLEGDILSIIEGSTVININLPSINEMLRIGRQTLIMLGIKELGSANKEVFSRAWEWAVRQVLLEEICKRHRCKIWERLWDDENTFEENERLIDLVESCVF